MIDNFAVFSLCGYFMRLFNLADNCFFKVFFKGDFKVKFIFIAVLSSFYWTARWKDRVGSMSSYLVSTYSDQKLNSLSWFSYISFIVSCEIFAIPQDYICKNLFSWFFFSF